VYVDAVNTTRWNILATAFNNGKTGLTTGAFQALFVEVWVARGTYKPTTTTDKQIPFTSTMSKFILGRN
jgi:hypothetical protein